MNIDRWLVGITGGIAAYKAAELVRLLKKQGKEVRVVLSQGAKAFITPLTLQALSGQPVYSELLDYEFEAAMGHIELARWAQGIVIAPLSANRLAALALGMADDLLTTLCLATTAPIWVAPAMNRQMWQHSATQQHITTLKNRGISVLGPDWGEQACGEVGLGRMLEPTAIIEQLKMQTAIPNSGLLKGRHILITAGPTREALDPVRYLSNRSSGKMGFALAEAALALGASVTLIAGPVALNASPLIERIDVTSALEMQNAVLSHYVKADIFISAAAVADYRPKEIAAEKIKKSSKETEWQLKLIANPDILAMIASKPDKPFCVGFAAETSEPEYCAQQKLINKNLDLIAVNDVSRHDIGFDTDDNALLVLTKQQNYSISKAAKAQVAYQLLTIISECYAKNKA